MSDIITRSLLGKLVTFFLLVALVPTAIVGYFSFVSARDALQKAEYGTLDVLKQQQEVALRAYFAEVLDALTFLSKTARIRDAVVAVTVSRELQAEMKSQEAPGKGIPDTLKPYFDSVTEVLSAFLEAIGQEDGNEDFFLADATDGYVFYTQQKLVDYGVNLKSGSLKASGLDQAWEGVVRTQKPCLTDFAIYEPTGSPAMFAGMPVFSPIEKRLVGVLVLRLNAERINRIMKTGVESGKTSKAYVVGQDLLMRSASRFDTGSSVLKTLADAEPVRLALQGKKGSIDTKDYRGQNVYSSYGLMSFSDLKDAGADFKWAMVSEIDRSEAIRPAQKLALTIFLIAGAVGLVVILVAILLARNIARPVTSMASFAEEVSRGDLTVAVPALSRKDEIGTLGEAFRVMLANLRNQMTKVAEGVSVLSSAASEISATVTQVSSSASETSSAIAQTTTTVEEVKQAARLSGEKAKSVAQSAHEAVKITESGKKATEDSIHRMSLIKEQMESIGDTVVKLSDHSRAIEDIIATVQDLADQSNLLAVNASIEAARAGDQGKGFAVVAQEIKALADQSKQATEQVRAILNDTRRWVSAVVMATEQGGKAVEAGVQQSRLAGDSIKVLSGSVTAAAQAASIINASSEQQFVGVEQVANAMVSIDQAMQQNMSGTVQLEQAAKRLEELGLDLKKLADSYKV